METSNVNCEMFSYWTIYLMLLDCESETVITRSVLLCDNISLVREHYPIKFNPVFLKSHAGIQAGKTWRALWRSFVCALQFPLLTPFRGWHGVLFWNNTIPHGQISHGNLSLLVFLHQSLLLHCCHRRNRFNCGSSGSQPLDGHRSCSRHNGKPYLDSCLPVKIITSFGYCQRN